MLECNGYVPLENLTPAIAKIFDKYDFPPYVPKTGLSPGGIPFIDFGNQIHEDGAFIDPDHPRGVLARCRSPRASGNPIALPGQAILVGGQLLHGHHLQAHQEPTGLGL